MAGEHGTEGIKVNCCSNAAIELLHLFDSFTAGRVSTVQGG